MLLQTASRVQFHRRALVLSASALAVTRAPGWTWRAFAHDATPTGVAADNLDVVQRQADVVYGEVDGETLLLDISGPPVSTGPHPAVILIHGGGLTMGGRYFMYEFVRPLNEEGYVTFNITYRLFSSFSGRNPWPAQIDDVQRAVRWVRANAAAYGVDPERVGALGHSSGGHLAALLGTRETRDNTDPTLASYSSRVSCVVDLAGETDVAMEGSAIYFTEILGGTPDEVPEMYRDASPLFHIDEATTPFLILQGANDEAVPIEQSRVIVEALHDAGVEVIYGEFPGQGHIALAEWRLVGPFVLAFLGRHLIPGN